MESLNERLDELLQRLKNMEASIAQLLELRTAKEWYSTAEVGKILGKAEFTIREWCRLGRVHCEKKHSGRGQFQGWVISHAELLRIQREGLLPQSKPDIDLSQFNHSFPRR